MSALQEALSSLEFLAGLRTGAIAVLVGGAGCWIWRSKTGQPAAAVGLLVTTAALLALPGVRSVPIEVLLGLGLLGAAGLVAGALSHSLVLNVAMALPGSWLILETVSDVYSGWGRWFLLGSMALGGPLTAVTDKRLSNPVLGPLLLAISLAGVYLDVPDTEEMLVLLGVMTLLVLLGWPLGVSRLGSAGSYLTVGLLVWAAAWGGVGRPASIVGAAACLGVLILVPLVVRQQAATSKIREWPALVAIHLLVVGVSSRVSGFRTEPLQAGLIAAAALLVGASLTIRVLRDEAMESLLPEPHRPGRGPFGG